VHILQILILLPKWNIDIKALSLFLNFVIEVGMILIISKIISLKILGFNLKKESFSFAIKSYITILPVITALLFINYFIFKNIGIKLNPNPAIGIFLSLKNNFLFFMLIAQIILFGPLSEELFFRGFLYNVVRQRYGFWLSALMISAVFMLLHKSAQEAFTLFFLSMVLCYVYEKTKNIAVPVILHILNNSASAIFLFAIKTLL
jgi:membrane protease YdiL (CAAX protease family)